MCPVHATLVHYVPGFPSAFENLGCTSQELERGGRVSLAFLGYESILQLLRFVQIANYLMLEVKETARQQWNWTASGYLINTDYRQISLIGIIQMNRCAEN
jgi:hypothetical protein